MGTAHCIRPDIARAYRRVDREAAILGSDPHALTILCFDELLASLKQALRFDADAYPAKRNDALIRANAALSALRMGIDPAHPVAGALTGLFDLAERSLRGAMVRFNAAPIEAIAQDFADIRQAMAK